MWRAWLANLLIHIILVYLPHEIQQGEVLSVVVKCYCYDLCSLVLWLYYFTKVSINSAIFLPLFQ